jgi:heat shock protein beta
MTRDYDDPMSWIHFKAEGEVEFTSLLFIPKKAPHD